MFPRYLTDSSVNVDYLCRLFNKQFKQRLFYSHSLSRSLVLFFGFGSTLSFPFFRDDDKNSPNPIRNVYTERVFP